MVSSLKQVNKLVDIISSDYNSTPMYSVFQKLDEMGVQVNRAMAMLPQFNFWRTLMADMIFRKATEQNFTVTIHGLRGSYKSITAQVLALTSAKIGDIKWTFDWMVDNDSDMLDIIQEDLPPFSTIIIDEQDITSAGAGNLTAMQMSKDAENRIRARQINIIRCCPQLRYGHVSDYFLETKDANRKDRRIRCFLSDYHNRLMGHINIPMPPDFIFDAYKGGKKKVALDRTKSLLDPMLAFCMECAKDLRDDPNYPGNKKRSNSEERRTYIAMKFPKLRSERLRRRVECLVSGNTDFY